MKRRRLTPAQIERAAELRELGWSCKRIGNALGVSASAVSWHCLRLGADPPNAKPLPAQIRGPTVLKRGDHQVRRFTPDEDATLERLAKDGARKVDMCRALGRKHNSIVGRLMTLARRQERGIT